MPYLRGMDSTRRGLGYLAGVPGLSVAAADRNKATELYPAFLPGIYNTTVQNYAFVIYFYTYDSLIRFTAFIV